MLRGHSLFGSKHHTKFRPLHFKTIQTAAPSETPKPISYLEFQSNFIKLIEKIAKKNIHSKRNISARMFHELLEDNTLLKKAGNIGQLCVAWPFKSGIRDINFSVKIDRGNTISQIPFSIEFYDHNKENFLTLTVSAHNKLTAEQHECVKSIWTKQDIEEITDNFNELFLAKKIIYINPDQSTSSKEPTTSSSHFSKEAFSKMIDDYKKYSFTYRINNIILKNASQTKNTYQLTLDWLDNKSTPHKLSAAFTRSSAFVKSETSAWPDEFHSEFISEERLLNSFPEFKPYNIACTQCYYTFQVYEDLPDKQGALQHTPIISMWLTTDGSYAELLNIDKGIKLTGNEVVNIYKYFDALFKPKITFLCDGATLKDEKEEQSVCLRAILSIANCKTWYESKITGLRLFEQDGFNNGVFGVVDQNPTRRNKALHELQCLTLNNWHKMLNDKQQKILVNLYKKYVNKSDKTEIVLDQETTLQKLTQLILLASQKNHPKLSMDLITLSNLLHTDMHMPYAYQTYPDVIEKDFWVKSRMYELIWNSFYWIKTQSDEKEGSNSKIAKPAKQP